MSAKLSQLKALRATLAAAVAQVDALLQVEAADTLMAELVGPGPVLPANCKHARRRPMPTMGNPDGWECMEPGCTYVFEGTASAPVAQGG